MLRRLGHKDTASPPCHSTTLGGTVYIAALLMSREKKEEACRQWWEWESRGLDISSVALRGVSSFTLS